MALPLVDHLVYAVPEVAAAVEQLAERFGVRASSGGQHRGRGTHNFLLSLGESSYLEIIGPDPKQDDPPRPRPFGLDHLVAPKLATWAIPEPDLEARVAAAKASGYDPGNIQPMSRDTPDGVHLEWRLTLRPQPAGDGLVPFLIDWADTTHPAQTGPSECRLVGLRAEHPKPDPIASKLAALGVSLEIEQAVESCLIATIRSPRGEVVLR